MRNIKLVIGYDGTNYSGWQIQRNTNKTIQHILERALKKVLQEKVKVIGAGRTDSGVHALAQAANFKTNSKLSTQRIQRALNGVLPKDIAVNSVKDVAQDFHSRYNSKSKTYNYVILQGPSRLSIGRNYFSYIPFELNVKKMRAAAKFLKGRHNFNAFCASGSSIKDTVRTIKKLTIKISRKIFLGLLLSGYRFLIIEIEADGFLYNMARNIVGTLIEVGKGRFLPKDLKRIIKSKDRKNAGQTVPACGLILLKVNY